MNHLPAKMKELRIKRKWTQEELASRINVSSPTISLYESGSRVPPLDTLNKIAEVFCVDISYLVSNLDTEQEMSPRIMRMIADLQQLSEEDLEFVHRVIAMAKASDKRINIGGDE